MMPPDALHGWAPWTGQWCSFAISSLRRTRATYGFRARFDSVQRVAVRLELVDRFPRELGGGQDRDIVLPPRLEDRRHARTPFSVPENMVIEDERPDVRRPEDPDEVCEGPLRVFLRIMFGHVRHRAIHIQDRRLRVDQERELPAEDGRRPRVVMVEMVMADREDVRLLRGAANHLPQFLLSRPLGRMGREVVPVRAESDARVQEDRDIRRLDERRHGSRAEAVRRKRRNLHRITACPHIYRETIDRISVAMAFAAAARP